MIVVEEIEIDGIKFRKTVSDSGFYITRDGAKYSEAIDPIEFTDRIYTETDEVIEYENQHNLITEDDSNMEDPRH